MPKYIENTEFENCIKRFYLSGLEADSETLFVLFSKLFEGIQNKYKFKVHFEDAKMDCVGLCFCKIPNFQKNNGAAFNYFTTIIINQLRQLTTKEKRHNEKIEALKEIKRDELLRFS